MPKKPRSPRKKLVRKMDTSILPKLDQVIEDLADIAYFYVGESDSANELSAKCEAAAFALRDISNAIKEHIRPKM